MLFQVTEDVFAGIEFGRIGGKVLQVNPAFLTVDKVFYQAAPMGRQSIPYDQQWSGDMAHQVSEELHQLWTFDRPGKQSKIESPQTDSGHDR
jgi:hypothetical protein